MRPHNRFDVQPLLVAEVIIHRSDVCTGALADVAHRGAIETSLGKDLARGLDDSFTSRIYFVGRHRKAESKLVFKTLVLINCMVTS
jgi:hypothetical protein